MKEWNLGEWRSAGMGIRVAHTTWWWSPKMSEGSRHLKLSKSSMRLSKQIQILHKSLSKWVEFLYINYPILNFTRAHTFIYSVRVLKNRWENSNETHLKFPQKTSHMGGVTFFYYDTS